MKKRITTILLVVFSVTVSVIMAPAGRCLAQADQPLPNRVNFNAHIRPILTKNCYNCHGPDKSKVEAGLQLHNRTSAFAALGGDDDRHAIVAGNRAKSLLIERIRSDDPDERMPPPESKMTLSERDKQLLERWISEGANWQEHWSLIAPVAVTVPSVRNVAWPRNAYDAFILRELESRAITPSSELSKSAWLRRVTLDLTGLPPSPSERQAFLDDSTELAYERVIDRLLESDASAEQLTLHWLDNARFADSNGYQYDGPNDQWPWRNWVINAFKSHMPFDQFVTEQLAGDLLPNSTFDQKIATAFNRNHGFTIEGGVTPEEYRVQYVNDRVMTFSTVFLGLTLECSRCHDHKFDDVTMHDFYSLSSFFDNIPGTGFWGGGLNTVSTPVIRYSTSDAKKVTRLKQQLVELQAEVERVIRQEEFPDFELWKKHLVDGERQAKVIKVSAADGVKVTDNKDGSWGFGGETNPDKTQIQFVLETEATDLRSLIVQPLPVNGKIGRSRNGQAVLSFIEATIESTRDTASSQRITFSSVIAASHVKKESAELALTADPDGWRLIRGAMPKQAIAVFSAPDQFGYKGGSRVTVTLHFESKAKQHSFARLQLRLSAEPTGKHAADHFRFEDGPKPAPTTLEQLRDYYVRHHHGDFEQRLAKAIRGLREEEDRSVPVMVMVEQAKKRPTKILQRGNWHSPGEEVSPAVPELLGGWRDEYPKNRVGLASWLVSPENPLLARVTVNRYWQMLFGVGLVKTTEDFGSQGEPPSHPELLDIIALDFIASGWDVRHLLKKMVLSATYRQVSTERADLDDPENRLLARGPRFRLPAESLRDQALFVSGLLVSKIGGPSVMTYQPEGLWLDLGDREGFTRKHVVGTNTDIHRRSMYIYGKRAMPNPVMSTFDAPSRDVCVVKRERTNTPLQALVLRHELGYVEAARAFAERLTEQESTLDAQLRKAWLLLLTRPPHASELDIVRTLYSERQAYFNKNPKVRDKLLNLGTQPLNSKLDPVDLASLTEVCRVLFNLSETVTRE